jgi:hypothetical protein
MADTYYIERELKPESPWEAEENSALRKRVKMLETLIKTFLSGRASTQALAEAIRTEK